MRKRERDKDRDTRREKKRVEDARAPSLAPILAHCAVVTVPQAPVSTVPHPGYVPPPVLIPVLRTPIGGILGGIVMGMGTQMIIIRVGRDLERDREVHNTLTIRITLTSPPRPAPP
jgi:hypothetical protein